MFGRFLHTDTGGASAVAAAPPVRLREILRRFWPDARPYRRWIPLGLLLIALGAAAETAEIWIFKLVVDDVLVPGELAPLVWIGGVYLGLALTRAVLSFGDEYLATWLGERFLLSLRTRVFRHAQALTAGSLDRRRLGDLVARLTADVQAIESLVLSGVADGLSSLLRLVFFTGALFYLQWQLALVALVVAPLFWVTARRFSTAVKAAAREKRRRSGSLSAVVEESLGNMALVQSSGREDAEVERFTRENEGIVRAELASTRIRALFAPVIDLIELAGLMVVLVAGTLAVADGGMTLGGLLVFLAYLSQMYGPVRELGSLSNTFFAASAAAERVIEILDEEPRVSERPDALDLGRARGVVRFDGVAYAYPGSERPAVESVSFVAAPGETVALVGPSGAGKSTLARMLMRFDDPDTGTVRLDGHDLRELTLRSARGNVSLLLQEAPVMHGSIRENIAFGNPDAGEAQIESAAAAAGAQELGLDTEVGERGRLLSGGQRQRIAIARALVADAPVLLLDEPTTGLDRDSRRALVPPLRKLMRDRTTILITHDLELADEADIVLVMRDGRIVERRAGATREQVTA